MDIVDVERRNPAAKAKQLRRAGIVPCSVYGGALPEAVSIQMTQQAANLLLRTRRNGSKVRMRLDGQVISAVIKEISRNRDNFDITHISFQALQAGQSVNSVCHVYRENAESVRGVLEQMLDEIPYESLPEDMVDFVTVDLAGKTAGTVIKVGDIPELNNDRITLKLPADEIVLRITEAQMAADTDADDSQEA